MMTAGQKFAVVALLAGFGGVSAVSSTACSQQDDIDPSAKPAATDPLAGTEEELKAQQALLPR